MGTLWVTFCVVALVSTSAFSIWNLIGDEKKRWWFHLIYLIAVIAMLTTAVLILVIHTGSRMEQQTSSPKTQKQNEDTSKNRI